MEGERREGKGKGEWDAGPTCWQVSGAPYWQKHLANGFALSRFCQICLVLSLPTVVCWHVDTAEADDSDLLKLKNDIVTAFQTQMDLRQALHNYILYCVSVNPLMSTGNYRII